MVKFSYHAPHLLPSLVKQHVDSDKSYSDHVQASVRNDQSNWSTMKLIQKAGEFLHTTFKSTERDSLEVFRK